MEKKRANPVTLENLRRAIESVFIYVERKGQSRRGEWDFHNDFYSQLENWRNQGLSEDFWTFLVDELWNWRAIRPKSKHEIFEEGIREFSNLKHCFEKLTSQVDKGQPSIEFLGWDDVSPLFDLAFSIKDSRMPTFGSKLCHFLFPSAYFVSDNTLVKKGWKNYSNYWEDLQAEWLKSPDKESLEEELRRNIPGSPCDSYPWPTKITELCQFR
jgi:hypothetical protein